MKNFKILLLLIIPFGIYLSACKKETGSDPQQTTTTTTTKKVNTIDSLIYFKGIVGGVDLKLFRDTIYTNIAGDSVKNFSNGPEYLPFSFVVKVTKSGAIVFPQSGGITFIYDDTTALGSADYRNIITVKSYTYGKLSTSSSSKGVSGARVFYFDANGVEWATDKGIGTQSGSFIVSSYVDYTDPIAPGTYKKIQASFSCILYDGKGNSKTLTNGSFSGKIMTK